MTYSKHAMKHDAYPYMLEWRCRNARCRTRFAEYVNGCPRCATGEPGGSHRVALERATPLSASTGAPS